MAKQKQKQIEDLAYAVIKARRVLVDCIAEAQNAGIDIEFEQWSSPDVPGVEARYTITSSECEP